MNRWVQRGLRTALLTGGLLAAGAGVAAADENDLTADVLGVTATVPVDEDATVGTPVVTGTGADLAVGGDGGPTLPADTDTDPGTTLLGRDGTGGVSVPVRVTEATDAAPDPRDGLTVTAPVNTSGGGDAGTTVTAPVATGDLGEVLDGDPLSGLEVDIDLADPVVPGPGGSGVLLDLADTVTIGDADGMRSPDTVLAVPAGLDGDRPTTVALPLPLPGGEGRGPLSGDDIEVRIGGLLGAGPGSGSVVAVPVDEGRTGTLGDLLVRITLPVDLFGGPGRDADGGGAGGAPGGGPDGGDGDARSAGGPVPAPGGGHADGGLPAGREHVVATGTSGRHADCGTPVGTPADSTAGVPAQGTGGGSAAPGGGYGDGRTEACGTGTAAAVGVRPSSSGGAAPAAAAAGLLVLAVGALAAAGRSRLSRR